MTLTAIDEGEPLAPPDAIPRYRIYEARFEEIDGDPHNVRATLENIPKLAESIEQHGLLENLVAVEVEPLARKSPAQWLELKAGSRRFEAIRRLIEKGAWPLDRPIPVLIITGNGFWQHLVENVQRMDVEPWDLGRRLSEAVSAGATHREVGYRLGHSNGWVSRHIQIGTGLSPKTIEHIKKAKLKLTFSELFRLSQLRDRFGDPDPDLQIATLEKQRRRRRSPKRRTKDDVRAFYNRIYYLKEQMPVPPLIRPVVKAMLDYLEGGGRPNFRALSDQIMGERLGRLPEGES